MFHTFVVQGIRKIISNSLNGKRIASKKGIGTRRLYLSDIANYDHEQHPYFI